MKSYKFTINGNTFEVDVISVEGTTAQIEVNGTTFEVEIHGQTRQVKSPPVVVKQQVKEPKKEIEKKAGQSKTTIKAPLPGLILNILVKPGDTVSKGQKLYVMEAMKMENEIKAERDGVITAVMVTEGQSVLQEEVIMEMD